MRPMPLLDRAPSAELLAELAQLFEGAPRFLQRLAEARPFRSDAVLLERAREIAGGMPEGDQVELLNAHPRIGAEPASLSAFSHAEQGSADETAAHVADDLERLNEAYEHTFGFRFVVFVAGRPRVAMIPLMEAALSAERDDELRRGLDDVVAIAGDRLRKLRKLRSETA